MEKENSKIPETDSHRKLMQIRNELKNIRAQQSAMKMSFKHELDKLQHQLHEIESHSSIKHMSQASSISSQNQNHSPAKEKQICKFEPIGYIESVYKQKNGIPRQPGICQGSRSKLTVSRQTFSNPHHLLHGLNDFSHLWIIFVFHKNKDGFSAAKVKPPRLNGAKVGVFATRSPHRPNAIGLTLAQIDRIEDNVIHLLGADILDGTPVLDIKPYIPEYDSVAPYHSHMMGSTQHVNTSSDGLCVNAYLTPSAEYISSVISSPASSPNCNTEELYRARHTPSEEVGRPCRSGSAETMAEFKTMGDDVMTTALSKLQEAAELDVEAVAEDETLMTACCDFKDGSLMQSDLKLQTARTRSCSEKSDEDTERNASNRSRVTCNGNSDAGRLDFCVATDQPVQVAEWIRNPPSPALAVRFTERANEELNRFSCQAEDSNYRLSDFETARDFWTALESILGADPRSVYRRKQCTDRLYYMTLDRVHVTCWFDGNAVEVVKICPANTATRMNISE